MESPQPADYEVNSFLLKTLLNTKPQHLLEVLGTEGLKRVSRNMSRRFQYIAK